MDNSLSIRNLHFENIPLDQEFEDRIGQGERRLVGNKDYRRVGKEDTDIGSPRNGYIQKYAYLRSRVYYRYYPSLGDRSIVGRR